MAQRRPHVPKFSDFEGGDDYSYAAYLDTPYHNKGTGVKTNQIGPERIQDKGTAVRITRNGLEKSPNKGKERGNDRFPPISVSAESTPGQKRQNYHRRENSRSIASEPGNEKSSTDNFVNRNRGKDNWKKTVVESDYHVPSSPEYGSINHLLDMSYGSVSVPKFGAWDAKDASSADGFTVIFDKVKEEKQVAASKFQVKPPQVVTHTIARKEKKNNKGKSKTGLKNCWQCCLFPSEKDQ